MSVGYQIRSFIRNHRRSWPIKAVARGCEKYLRAWHNEDFYHFDQNGEGFALRCFASWSSGKPQNIWDVGAHEGEWALTAEALLPGSTIHSFEIVPATAKKLTDLVKGHPNIVVHATGLSDKSEHVEVVWNELHDTTSSIAPMEGSKYYREGGTRVSVRVVTADSLIDTLGTPDLLKIDVEGHELSVLAGAQALLSSSKSPAMLQIEYGPTYLPSSGNLKRLYDLVLPHGYHIGRLYPRHVEFKEYEFSDDNFRMGNFIAVRDARLRNALG